MKDYRVVLRVKNNRILQRIEEAGYSSVADFCRQNALNMMEIGKYINQKKSPLLQYNEWSKTVIALADALYCFPDDLFTDAQAHIQLKTNKAEALFSEEEMKRIATPENIINRMQLKNKTSEALARLTSKEQFVINHRYGFIDGVEKSAEEVGIMEGVSRSRICQIEQKALRKLRHPIISKKLREFITEI